MGLIKKLIVIIVVLVALFGAGMWYAYYKFIPQLVGKAIVGNQEASVLPGPYQEKIQSVRKPVNYATEKLIHEIDSIDIPFAAIIRLIDNTENETVVRTYQELKTHEPSNPDEIFDIIKKNVPSEEFDLERFRKPFLRYATMDRYDYGMRYIENNEIIEQINDMPYREIVKEVLIQKRAEIDRRLKTSGGPTLQ
jgi:hypothetical protein